MFKKLVSISFIVFVLSLFLWEPNVSFADESDDRAIDAAMEFAENKSRDVDQEINKLKILKDAMDLMISEWEGNKSDIVNGIELTLAGALGTTASAAVNVFSGGTLSITTKTAALFTLKKAIDVGLAITAHSGYVEAMEAAINAVDSQIEMVEKAKVVYSEVYDDDPNTYNGAYERYLNRLAAHTGWTAEDIDERVNTSDIDDDKFPHKKSVTPSHKHFGDERNEFVYEDLPSDYECDGPCSDLFRSPHKAFAAHRTKCGTEMDVDIASIRSMSSGGKTSIAQEPGVPTTPMFAQEILDTRTAEQGCGRNYYDCPSAPDTEHKVRTCNKWIWKKRYVDTAIRKVRVMHCGDSYRRCMAHKREHGSSWWETKHDDDASDANKQAYSYDEAPNPEPPDTISNIQDLTPNCDSCTNGCSACPTAGPCGHTYSSAEFTSHVATMCYETDAYGNYCTATDIYVCQTHTHQYPTGKCGRIPCTIPVSYANQHKLTCINGHTYWSCVSWQHELHRTRDPCTRNKWTPWEWSPSHNREVRFWQACGETWANCDTRCEDGNGAVGQHQE